MDVEVYSYGPLACSACAPAELDADAVARAVNEAEPTGIETPWRVSRDATFSDGATPNPAQCEGDSKRRHWLLEC